MSPAAAHPGNSGGFTLLELLIATVVAAFILIVINGVFFGALKLNNSTHDRIDRELVLYRALDQVRRDVSGVMLAKRNPTAPAGTFSGQFQDTPTDSPTQEFTATRVSPDFYTTSASVDGWNPFSEVQVVTYFLSPATDGSNTKNLVRAVTRNLLPATQATTDEQVVMKGLSDTTFDYYDGTEWTTTWDSTATYTLPVAVRMSMTLARSGQGPAPDPIQLVIPVMVSTSTSLTQAIQAQSNGGGQ